MTTSQPLGPGQVPSSPLVVGFYSPSVESPSSSDLPQHQAAQASVATGRHSADPITEKIDPHHYQAMMPNGQVLQTWDAIEAFGLNYNLGNVVKYVSRDGKKDGEEGDVALFKAAIYIEREVNVRRARRGLPPINWNIKP